MYSVAFANDTSEIDPMDIIVDILFFLDLVLSFFTAFKKKGKLVTDFNTIAKVIMNTKHTIFYKNLYFCFILIDIFKNMVFS